VSGVTLLLLHPTEKVEGIWYVVTMADKWCGGVTIPLTVS